MLEPSQFDAVKKLAELQLAFKRQLPDKELEIKRLWGTLNKSAANDKDFKGLHRVIHNLAGSAGTFDAVAVGKIARKLYKAIKPILSQPQKPLFISAAVNRKIDDLIDQLSQAIENWQPSGVPYIQSVDSGMQSDSTLVYLAEDDELLARNLVIELERAGYHVRHFSELASFEKAFEQEIPAAVLMDVIFEDDNITGADVIARLNTENKNFPAVIFISVHDDIETRLAAARAGAQRYFCKPLDVKKLILSLDSLTERIKIKPYRVLLIDDNEALLEYYATVLTEAGMVAKALSNPLESLGMLSDFNPDLIVLDVHMPECSGPELAQIIRQDDTWAMMPIMFLSSELDVNRQLAAMNMGGDDFLVKPVKAEHLVSAVTARAKWARWTRRLNNDLNDALRENRFQLVTMDQHDIVSTADIAGRITSVNDKFCEVSGYSREELLGKNDSMIKSGYHSASFYEDIWRTITHGKVWHGVICNHKKNGEEYWVESTIVPFMDEGGRPYKYVSARTDITATRQNSERLNRGQQFANIGTWDWNIRTNEMYWSDRIGWLFGYQDKVPEPSYENFLSAVYPVDREWVLKAIKDCVENSAKYDVEHRVVWPDGSMHWVRNSGDVVRSEDGAPLHMLGVVRDIDIRKRAEKDLIEAREEADNANRAKSQFLSSMSHELRTPMNAIMGFSQLLKMEEDQPLNESQLENINEITKAGTHLLELINEVLDLAKVESGNIDLSIEAVVLGEIISESLQLIMPLVKKRRIEIHVGKDGVDIDFESLPYQECTVRADRTRLKQVLLNLLSNAVKYNCENGKLTIAFSQADNSQIRISVSDTGAGITVEQQSQLFKAFNRLGLDQSEIEGTGIGLVITKNIVEMMGGSIGADSEPGKGSTFWVEFPADTLLSTQIPMQQVIQEDVSDNGDAAVSSFPGKAVHEHTVLYIEDNPANLRLVAQLLGRMESIHMWSAHEPMLGLELAAEHKPDLILLDINLPGMDGFGVLKHLRQREATSNTPVIAISANAMPKDIEKGLKAGFDDYITKPIDVTALLKSVDDVLMKKDS